MSFVLEQSERYSVEVNGKLLDKKITGHWIDPCFDELVLPAAYLRKGENVVRLTAKYEDSLNLECAYILGEFGVSLRGSAATICKLPETLALGDVTGQGLPFYSGSIAYHTASAIAA